MWCSQATFFELWIDSGDICVFDADLDIRSVQPKARHQIISQGFSWQAGIINFCTFTPCSTALIEVYLCSKKNHLYPDLDDQEILSNPSDDPLDQYFTYFDENIVNFYPLKSDTVRAIVLPYNRKSSQIKISSNNNTLELLMDLSSSAHYALLFEMRLRNDSFYLNSYQYHQDLALGRKSVSCRLTFIPQDKPIQPEILRADAALNPTYPLIMR